MTTVSSSPTRSGPRLSDVRCVRVPRAVADAVQSDLRAAGRRHREGVGFWAGVQDGTVFDVQAAYVPTQYAGQTKGGSLVLIDGKELFEMNVWLHRRGLTLVAQIHSHPADAYHSATDDDLAVMSQLGGLSIVIPDFAVREFDLGEAAVYRLGHEAKWRRLSPVASAALIKVIES